MNLFYMNQGGGGNWGALSYKDYEVVMLAESNMLKDGFTAFWSSAKDSLPVMSVQTQGAGRVLTAASDLDFSMQHVRPLVTFTVVGGDAVRVVFVHLKSADENAATLALTSTVQAVAGAQFGRSERVIWVGDFNRAKIDPLKTAFPDLRVLMQAGGQALWNLDCAYASGDWKNYAIGAKVVSIAGDNAHAGIVITYEKAKA